MVAALVDGDRRLSWVQFVVHLKFLSFDQDVRPPGGGCGDQHDRSGFEQPINLRPGNVVFFIRDSFQPISKPTASRPGPHHSRRADGGFDVKA